ncbi:MAG: hypothetical protein CL912_27705 [Deltaproteobacteria bacterium]|nr:hypothetical protein [Deltaproteobacteria bacterium]
MIQEHFFFRVNLLPGISWRSALLGRSPYTETSPLNNSMIFLASAVSTTASKRASIAYRGIQMAPC